MCYVPSEDLLNLGFADGKIEIFKLEIEEKGK
jgi:hypothetical protein